MNRLTLIELHARRLHGFRSADRCMLSGLGAGLNIVYAPNRSGKSTLALAYCLVIGEDLRRYGSADIAASWAFGTSEKEAIVTLGQRHDSPAPAALPMRHVLDLPEMVGGLSAKDKESTEKAVAGNVIIPDDRPLNKGLKSLADSLRNSNKDLREIDREVRSLETKRTRIRELEQVIDQSSRVGDDLRWLRVAKLNGQILQLDSVNTGIERQTEDATLRLDERLEEIKKATDEVREAMGRLDSVAPGPDQRAPWSLRESDNASITRLLNDHDQALAEYRRAKDDLSGVNGSLNLAIKQLATNVEPDEVIPCSSRFVDLADRARAAKWERAAYMNAAAAVIVRQAEEKAERGTPKSSEHARRALLALFTASPPRPSPRVSVTVLLILGAITALIAAPVSFLNPMAVAALGVTSAIMVVIALVLLRFNAGNTLRVCATEDADKPEGMLDRWTEQVRKYEESSALERSWSFVRTWLEGKAATSPGADETEVETTWNHWKFAAGLDAGATPYHLATLFELWQNVQDLRHESKKLESQASERLEAATEYGDAIRNILGQYNWECGFGTNLADEVTSFLKWFDLSAALNCAEQKRERENRRLQEYLDSNGVPYGELEVRCDMLRGRASDATKRRNLEEHLNAELRELNAPIVNQKRIIAAKARWCKGGEIDLAAGFELARTASTQFGECRDELNRLETEIRLFEQGSRVAEARSRYDRAIVDLMRDCEVAQSNAVWNTLLSSVRKHVVREAAPELLTEANAKLERVDSALVLRIATPELDPSKEELGLLLIDDQKNGRYGQRFSELATSTKVNAVLAIRLALISKSEQGIAYPIIADELMAVADVNTRNGIARLLVEEAADRQVIVLTNQAEDAHALLEAAGGNATVLTIGGSGPSLPNVIAGSTLPTYVVPLGPVEPDLERDVEAHAPGFLLVEESDLMAVGDASTIAAALERLTSERKAELKPVLNALQEIHRYVATTTRRIGMSDMENQEWVTKTFQNDIFRILNETGGDPNEFRERVTRLKGYRDNNKNALDQFLTTNGFLGVSKPLFEDLVKRARIVLGGQSDANRTAQWCAMRYLRFCDTREDPY